MDRPAATFLFHQPKFIFRDPENSVIPFEGPHAKIFFSRIGDSLISLDKAPFGSFILDEGVMESDLAQLIENVEAWSRSQRITNMMIRSYPAMYQPHHESLIKNILRKSGFRVKYEDVTQIIPVAEGAMDLNTHKRRRVRKAEASEFSFRSVPLIYLEECYSLIVETRESKGYPVTMTLRDIEAMFKLFPENYLLFGVFDKSKLIGTAVSIKVNTEILYCFYIGDDLAYRSFSPVTTLIHGIYNYCQVNHFKMLDLGLSTDKGVLNKGLYTFKKSFGSVDSSKLTFLKQF